MYSQLRARMLPELENSQVTYLRALSHAVRAAQRWLDLGCGHSLVPDWMDDPPTTLERRAFGIDADLAALQRHAGLKHKVLGDAHYLPFQGEAFDLITANMVVEHIREPELLFKELRRVLRPRGRLILHTPNIDGYTTRLANLIPEFLKARLAAYIQQRRVEDVYPTFYRANSENTLRRAAQAAGLELVRCEYVLTSPQLYRFPFLVYIEMLWLKRLSRPEAASRRPVLIVTLARP